MGVLLFPIYMFAAPFLRISDPAWHKEFTNDREKKNCGFLLSYRTSRSHDDRAPSCCSQPLRPPKTLSNENPYETQRRPSWVFFRGPKSKAQNGGFPVGFLLKPTQKAYPHNKTDPFSQTISVDYLFFFPGGGVSLSWNRLCSSARFIRPGSLRVLFSGKRFLVATNPGRQYHACACKVPMCKRKQANRHG